MVWAVLDNFNKGENVQSENFVCQHGSQKKN